MMDGNPSTAQKLHLDRVHFAKILKSDSIYVMDVDSYVGPSTSAEIAWARLHDIDVDFLSQSFPNWKDDMDHFDHTMRIALPV